MTAIPFGPNPMILRDATPLGPDVSTPEGIAEGSRLRAAGWIDLEMVLPQGYVRLWSCPVCSATVLEPAKHLTWHRGEG